MMSEVSGCAAAAWTPRTPLQDAAPNEKMILPNSWRGRGDVVVSDVTGLTEHIQQLVN